MPAKLCVHNNNGSWQNVSVKIYLESNRVRHLSTFLDFGTLAGDESRLAFHLLLKDEGRT